MTDQDRYAKFDNRDQLLGMEYMCRLLLTSPRMKKSQVEVIEAQWQAVNDRLRALGLPTQEGPA